MFTNDTNSKVRPQEVKIRAVSGKAKFKPRTSVESLVPPVGYSSSGEHVILLLNQVGGTSS